MTVLALIIATVIAALLCPIVIRAYTKNGWLDDPEQNKHVKKTHRKAVPRGGGIIIFLTILFVSAFFLSFNQYLIAIMDGAALLAIV